MKNERLSLAAVLSERKSALVAKWLQQMLQDYPESSVGFLTQKADPFLNPVGHTLQEGLSVVFDVLAKQADASALQPALDGIIKIRAIQDISASQAVTFVFLFKQIIRAELAADAVRFSDELAALETRIDELALLAFDLFVKCRERIFEIKANESRRMTFLFERAHRKGTADSVNKAR